MYVPGVGRDGGKKTDQQVAFPSKKYMNNKDRQIDKQIDRQINRQI